MSLYRPMLLESETGRSVVISAELDDDFPKVVRVWFARCPNPELIRQHIANSKQQAAVAGVPCAETPVFSLLDCKRFSRDASRSGRILAHSNPTRL